MFNHCILELENFLLWWKVQTVQFLNDDNLIPNNYRPTSWAVFWRSCSTIQGQNFSWNFFNAKQFGFTRNLSCKKTIARITQLMRKTTKKQYGLAAAIDMKEAFDTVDHNLFLVKLDFLAYVVKLKFFWQIVLRKKTIRTVPKCNFLKEIYWIRSISRINYRSVIVPFLIKNVTKSSGKRSRKNERRVFSIKNDNECFEMYKYPFR